METLDSQDPLALAVTEAIRGGDLPALRQCLAEHPGLAVARIVEHGCGPGSRTLLHIAADWPGHFPNGPAVVAMLVAAGADPNARFEGAHSETPLHWAASSNDVPMLDALVRAGADIESAGAVIGGGTPLADARGFGQWRAAYRLVELGARTTLEDAATLGLLDRVKVFVEGLAPTAAEPVGLEPANQEGDHKPADLEPADQEPAGHDAVTRAFWGACHGGRLATAEYLLAHGADLDWIGYDDKTPLDIARAADADGVVRWLRDRGAKGRAELP
ncbi:ankyrin repeat domain-containing protein [Streptomyces sp. HC44]|uniref:Ankyrin repeat domain-containing protein n=1 Tax=Streptomyces scabichelini TaxID=2711217 RepID=A0A6G4VFP3_9ACTN|nr:ankyrin repeat domain-containing protein [Streptomyces scabichelini]NGO12634.1 ankyrin repeat domain-containing protein [Streptomyces scabichelini]